MVGPYRIVGYVIASADGMIADQTGVMPASLQLDPDKTYFEQGLDSAAAIVHGRHSQEVHESASLRRRLIVTRSVEGLARITGAPLAYLWNPAGASLNEALGALGVEAGTIAAIGGPQVYSLFLKLGYDVFHLSRAPAVRLPGGLPVFAREAFGGEPDASLRGAGLKPGPTVPLGEGVTRTDWTPA